MSVFTRTDVTAVKFYKNYVFAGTFIGYKIFTHNFSRISKISKCVAALQV